MVGAAASGFDQGGKLFRGNLGLTGAGFGACWTYWKQIDSALSTPAEPSFQQPDDLGQKRQIIVGQILPLLDKSQSF